MNEQDVADTVAAFAAAAKRLGFDTAEIHDVRGYLVDQFFWSGMNTRADRCGGETLKRRARFAPRSWRRCARP